MGNREADDKGKRNQVKSLLEMMTKVSMDSEDQSQHISRTLKKNNPAVKVYAVEANELQSFLVKNLDHIKSKGFQQALSQIL